MEEILNKFKLEFGFIKDINDLYTELIKYIDKKDALNILKNVIKTNQSIIFNIKKLILNYQKLLHLEKTTLK